ncbi:hypothetical protein X975_15232, partial [Stegodyphus mimosarum]
MTSFIRKDSPACVKSELDLFLIPPTQTAIEKGQYVEYHPLSNIRDGGPVEFNISGTGEEYLDLSSSYIYVKVKIVKANASALTIKDYVSPVNLFLHALFSQVDVSLNERIISASTNTYPYRAYIETLLNYGEDAKKSLLTCECFYKDTNLTEVNPLADKPNEGLKKRLELIKGSKTLDLIGQLHCDIFQQNRLLLNLVDVKIILQRSKAPFCLVSPEEKADYNVILEHASMFIRKVKVSPGVSLGHAKALEKSTAKYPIDRVLCKTYSVSQGSWSFLQDNVFLGVMPKRVIITCLSNAAMNGQYKSNPFVFHHYNVNFLSVYIDGHPIPGKPLELDFDSENYIRAYHSLFSGFNRDRGIYLSRDDFSAGHALYAFDLTPDLCNDSHLNLQQQGNLRVELKFSKALTETISVLIYAEFENVIEINKSRHNAKLAQNRINNNTGYNKNNLIKLVLI